MNKGSPKTDLTPVASSGVPTILGGILGVALLCLILGAIYLFGNVTGSDALLNRALRSLVINAFSFASFGAGILLLLTRRRWIAAQHQSFQLDLLGGDEDRLILPDHALQCRRELKELPADQADSVLVELLSAGLQRARANWSAEEVSAAVQSQTKLLQDHVDSQYAMIRYLAWAIPPIGFIGTVLGIGQAMGALQLTAGDSADVTQLAAGHLHTAFDTTLVALVLSVVLMFFFYRIQAQDDALIIRASNWCMRRLVYRMHIPEEQPS